MGDGSPAADDLPPRGTDVDDESGPPTGLRRYLIWGKIALAGSVHVVTLLVLVFSPESLLSDTVGLAVFGFVNLVGAFLWIGDYRRLKPSEESEP